VNSSAVEPRRAFALIAVLLVIGASALAVTIFLRWSGAEIAIASASAQRSQSRLLIDSGIAIILSELDGQRDVILEGRRPELERTYVVHEGSSRSSIIRLLSVGIERNLLVPVGGLLDVNLAGSAELVATGALTQIQADQIVARRSTMPGGRYRMLEDLLNVTAADGTFIITPEMLFGPLEDLRPAREVLVLEEDRGERALRALGTARTTRLSDLLTVHSFEPLLQRNGTWRIDVSVPFTEELGRRFDRTFGEGSGEVLRRVKESVDLKDDVALGALIGGAVPASDQERILDAVTADGRWTSGRIDINTAPAEVLQTLPGFDPESAAALVNGRDSLGVSQQAEITWPRDLELLSSETFYGLLGRITNRSWLWKLRFAAGTVPTDDVDSAMENPVMVELVVDLSAPRPRLASLRDIGKLDLAIRLLEQASLAESLEFEGDPEGDSAFEEVVEAKESVPNSLLESLARFEEGLQPPEEVSFENSEPPVVAPPGSRSEDQGPRGRWSSD
jgi:DNA uptake protein ComE-like DNA-binding protein